MTIEELLRVHHKIRWDASLSPQDKADALNRIVYQIQAAGWVFQASSDPKADGWECAVHKDGVTHVNAIEGSIVSPDSPMLRIN
jgi:hypothetical protein